MGAVERLPDPRIRGCFSPPHAGMDVEWGSAKPDHGRERLPGRERAVVGKTAVNAADGRFSLGIPARRRRAMNARMTTRMKLAELRHAFDLDEYPVDEALASSMYGRYRTVRVRPGHDLARHGLRRNAGGRLGGAAFRRHRVRFDGVDIHKSTGTILAPRVGWDGTYPSMSMDATSDRVHRRAEVSTGPPTGQFEFSAEAAPIRIPHVRRARTVSRRLRP